MSKKIKVTPWDSSEFLTDPVVKQMYHEEMAREALRLRDRLSNAIKYFEAKLNHEDYSAMEVDAINALIETATQFTAFHMTNPQAVQSAMSAESLLDELNLKILWSGSLDERQKYLSLMAQRDAALVASRDAEIERLRKALEIARTLHAKDCWCHQCDEIRVALGENTSPYYEGRQALQGTAGGQSDGTTL